MTNYTELQKKLVQQLFLKVVTHGLVVCNELRNMMEIIYKNKNVIVMQNLILCLLKKKLALYDEFERRKSRNTERGIYPGPLDTYTVLHGGLLLIPNTSVFCLTSNQLNLNMKVA